MPRITSRVWVAVVAAVSLGAAVAAQTINSSQGVTIGPAREGQPSPQPTVRRIPVGTSAISGTVTAADTGRPIRGARVTVNGTVGTPGAGRGAAPVGAPTAVGGSGAMPPVMVGGVTVTPGVVTTTIGRGGAPLNVAMGGSGLSRTVLTDASGEFSFPRLPAGQFTLNIFQSQYLQLTYGQKRPGGQGTTIRLADGEQQNLKIQMMRGGVITGTVYGEDGEPQRGVYVRAMRYMMLNGVRRLQQTGGTSTDDRGVYRVFGLQPGDYLLAATPNPSDSMFNERMNSEMAAIEQAIASGAVQPPAAPGLPATVSVSVAPPQPMNMPSTQPAGYLPVFAPSSLIPSGATTVTIAGGDERAGIDIQTRLAQASLVQGTVAMVNDPGVTVQVSLINDDPSQDTGSNTSTRVDQTGKFTFRTVAPGKYTVFAQTVIAQTMTMMNGQPVQPAQPPRLTDAQKLWGRASVTVEGQSSVDVNLQLRAARTISGMVVFEMAKPPDLTRSRPTVFLTTAPSASQIPMTGPQPSAQLEPDGRFTLTGVLPGRYILRGGTGVLKSAVVDGQDTADFPLDFTGEQDVMNAVLTFTDQMSELSGLLTDATGKPAADYTVIVAPSDTRYWIPGARRIVMTRPNPEGRYMFRALPPGDYVLAVVSDMEQGAQYDPEFLKSVAAGAVRVGIAEGGKVAQDLRVR